MDSQLCNQVSNLSQCVRKNSKQLKTLKNNTNSSALPFVNVISNIGITGTVATNEPIIYDEVLFDNQNLYNNTTGAVTIEEDGQYLVSFRTSYDVIQVIGETYTICNVVTKNGVIVAEAPGDDFTGVSPNSSVRRVTLQSTKIMSLVSGDVLLLTRNEIAAGGVVLEITTLSGAEAVFQVKKLL